MEQTLTIYDNDGKIFSQITGSFVVPNGLQHIITTIPKGKQLLSVNVETHEPIFGDIPKSETETLREEVISLNNQLLDVYEILLLGGM